MNVYFIDYQYINIQINNVNYYIYIMLLLLNKLIDTGCAGGAISPLRSSRKERKQEGGIYGCQ